MKCEICGKDYPSRDYFKTDTVCVECYEKQHPNENKQEKEEKKLTINSAQSMTSSFGCVSTFIGVLIWGGFAAIFSNLGLGGWSILLGLVIALILGPAIDMGLNALTGRK